MEKIQHVIDQLRNFASNTVHKKLPYNDYLDLMDIVEELDLIEINDDPNIECYQLDIPYEKGEMLFEFTLSTAISDNQLKKPRNTGMGFAKSDAYGAWIDLAKAELLEQGFSPVHDKAKLYGDSVIVEILYSSGRTAGKKPRPKKDRSDLANKNKAIHDLIQYLHKKHIKKHYKQKNGQRYVDREELIIDRDWGYFIQDDNQIKMATVKNWISTQSGGVVVRIYKVKQSG